MKEDGIQLAPEHEGKVKPGFVLSRLWAWTRKKWYRRWAVDLGILALILFAMGRFQARHLLEDGTKPSFSLQDLDGKSHRLEDYRGKVVVLQFFAPWCGVCRLESDNWARIQRIESEKIQVLAVALSYESIEDVIEFIGEDRGAYPVLLGNPGIQEQFRIQSFPSHYILNKDGEVVSQSAGYTSTLGYLMKLL